MNHTYYVIMIHNLAQHHSGVLFIVHKQAHTRTRTHSTLHPAVISHLLLGSKPCPVLTLAKLSSISFAH